jgi:hypothetical protein
MKDERKKDNLTELVDEIESDEDDGDSDNNGTVSTPTGELVELDYKVRLKALAIKIAQKYKIKKKNK